MLTILFIVFNVYESEKCSLSTDVVFASVEFLTIIIEQRVSSVLLSLKLCFKIATKTLNQKYF